MSGLAPASRLIVRSVVAIVCCLLVQGSLPAVSAQSRRVVNGGNRFPFTTKSILRVENPRGDIKVVVTPRSDVELLAGRHKSVGSEVRPEEITVGETDGQIVVTTNPSDISTGIDIKLLVPEGATLRLFSEIGNIEVTGAAGAVLATTGRGDVDLNVPPSLDADVALYSATGTVSSAQKLRTWGPADERSVQGQLGKGGPILMARSEKGSVRLNGLGGPTGAPAVTSSGTDRTIDIRNQPTDDRENRSKPELIKGGDPVAMPDTGKKSEKAEDDDVLRIESQLVTLNAAVSRRGGEPLVNLRKEDFSLYEDGTAQEVVHFQSVNTPFNLVLLIDLSGSIRDKIDLVKRAAQRFVQATRPEDKVAIVTFTGSTRVACPLTNDRNLLRDRIRAIRKPDGGTNFYDAVMTTINTVLADVRGERNAIVIMSDGVDNSLPGSPGNGSEATYDEMLDRVQEADTIVFPIYLDTEEQAVEEYGSKAVRGYAIARKQLTELAEATGGVLLKANEIEDLEGRYEQVAAELRTIYSLGYYPTNTQRDGTFRKIRVRVNRDDAQVRARRGYFAK